ncbi:hypothetical protein PSEUDO9AZ_40846 [Pseudomonas sp. 9AZ]|nr:hypothetical protein PSEUDO9AZ_40846 [Pseudomonas sp. 9AZ]
MVGEHVPAVRGVVETSRGYARAELDVPAQVKTLGDVLDIAQYFRLGREALAPAPLLLQLLRPGIGVLHAFGIAAQAWVAVCIPSAANIGIRVEYLYSQAETTQLVEQVKTGETGADDNSIDLVRIIRHRGRTGREVFGHAQRILIRRNGARDLNIP